MKRLGARLALGVLLAALVITLTYFTASANGVKLTVTVDSAYLRSGPGFTQPRVTSVFKGETYAVVGRTGDNTWVQLDVAGAPTPAWTLAAIGTLSGNLNDVPIKGALSSAASAIATAAPAVSAAPAEAAVPGASFTVTANSVNLRASPTVLSSKVGALYSGEKAAVLGRTADVQWLQVSSEGLVGWVIASAGTLNVPTGMLPVTDQGLSAPATAPSASAAPAAPLSVVTAPGAAAVPGAAFTVAAKGVNVRSGPSTLSDKIGTLFSGQTASVAGRSADGQWLQVSTGGLTGWVIASAGTLSLPLGMLPVTDQAQPVAPAPSSPGATPAAVTAVSGAAFTVTTQSLNFRASPTSASSKLGALPLGQTVQAVGRSTDGQWLQVASDGIVGWVIVSGGQLSVPAEALPITDKPLPVAPLTPTEPPPPRDPNVNLRPEWLPAITAKMQSIYSSYRLGKNPNMFTVAGDCNSDDSDYLVRVLAGRFDLTGYPSLNGIVAKFAGGLARHSLATHGGLSAATMFDTAWANPTYCRKSMGNAEGPLTCELRVSQASVVFFAVGTGDHPQWQSFEANYRHMIEFALDDKVLPVLMTKPDDIEALVDGAPSGYVNGVIRKLAAEYGVPLMDLELATRDLPNHGLLQEELPFHLSRAGFDMRTLFMLKMLELIAGNVAPSSVYPVAPAPLITLPPPAIPAPAQSTAQPTARPPAQPTALPLAPTAQPPTPPAAAVSAAASGSVSALRFTITVKSAYLRSEPSWTGAKIGSAFQGQVYTAVGRSVDSQWVQLQSGAPTWVGIGVGRLDGAVSTLAVTWGGRAPVVVSSATGVSPSLPLPIGVPNITLHMRQVYGEASKRGLNPLAFAMAGDCNSEPYIYMELAAANLIDISAYGGNLKEMVGQFYPSLIRKSVAVSGGFTTASMLDPQWADPKQCQSGEGPFACELRVTQASIVFIALGSGDHLKWKDFEQNYRRLIQYALGRGVLPVLVTKADDLEATTTDAPSGYINGVIRRLGTEYDVPVMDLEAATAGFWNHALQKDKFHLDEFGIKAHVLLTLQTLDAIWRAN